MKKQVDKEHHVIFIYIREQAKASKLWVFHHKIFNCISIDVASFPIFSYWLMYGAYNSSGFITHLLINIFISKLFLILFNMIIPILDDKSWTHIGIFCYNVFCHFINYKVHFSLHKTEAIPAVYVTDKISFLWDHGKEKLNDIIEHLNEKHPTIKFTAEWSQTPINFLDNNVSIIGGKIYSRFVSQTYR